ncbi:MAG: universal stress protein [Acidimicrobiales bacterium]|nr:universal stress protein [Acidimicrobiales bacterium]
MRKIVLGFDDSAGATCAREWVAGFARETEVEVTVVYVMSSSGDWGLAAMQIDTDTLRERVQGMLDHEWTDPLRAAGARVTTRVTEGHPAVELLKAGEAEGADLIVLGVAGHGGFSGRFLGGVAQKVAHHSTRPVVLVPCAD